MHEEHEIHSIFLQPEPTPELGYASLSEMNAVLAGKQIQSVEVSGHNSITFRFTSWLDARSRFR